MSRLFFFADESGCLTFNRNASSSRYFIVCTVSMESCKIGNDLLELRRELIWARQQLGESFHCTSDSQFVRDRVFSTLCRHDFEVQATIMEKSKAQPQVRRSKSRFYKIGWFYHFLYGAKGLVRKYTEILITAATIGTGNEKRSFSRAVDEVMAQTVLGEWRTNFCQASTDPCIQVADYCAWAIQRKWERGDERSYQLISDRITYEYDLWSHGRDHYY